MRPFAIVATASAAWRRSGRASSAANRSACRDLVIGVDARSVGKWRVAHGRSPLLGDHQGVGDRSGAQFDPEVVVVTGLCTLQCGVAGGASGLRGQRLADRAPARPRGRAMDGWRARQWRCVPSRTVSPSICKATAAEARAKA